MAKKILNSNIYYIYLLRDPINKKIKYVGKSNNPLNRLKCHLSNCYYSFFNSKMRDWLLELKQIGLTPIIEIIEECTSENFKERETFHIRQLLINGEFLFNANNQILKANGTIIANIIIPNMAMFIFEEIACSKNLSREEVMKEILMNYIKTFDLSSIESRYDNFLEFVSNNGNALF